MGTPLPVVSGRDCARALQTLGFELLPTHRGKGSHMALWRADVRRPIVVPDHKELDRGTLKSILRSAGIDVETFTNALR